MTTCGEGGSDPNGALTTYTFKSQCDRLGATFDLDGVAINQTVQTYTLKAKEEFR